MHNFEGKGAHTLQMYSLAARFLGREGGGCLLSHSQRMYTKPVSVLAGPLMPANFPRQPARAVTHTHTAHSAPATAPAHSALHSARAGSPRTAVPLAAVPTDRPLADRGPGSTPEKGPDPGKQRETHAPAPIGRCRRCARECLVGRDRHRSSDRAPCKEAWPTPRT